MHVNRPETIDISMRLWGINPTNSPEPCAEVYCLKLNKIYRNQSIVVMSMVVMLGTLIYVFYSLLITYFCELFSFILVSVLQIWIGYSQYRQVFEFFNKIKLLFRGHRSVWYLQLNFARTTQDCKSLEYSFHCDFINGGEQSLCFSLVFPP